jgi:hypothetical protein
VASEITICDEIILEFNLVRWRNITTPSRNQGSPARRNVFGSIERGLDRVRLMLTPRAGKDKKKLRTIDYNINKVCHAMQ